MTPETCPHCGADVPRGAKACPECGSDENTGWSEEAHTGGLDLPDQQFDYDDYVRREFGGKRTPVPSGIRWYWWLAALIVLIAFLLLWFH